MMDNRRGQIASGLTWMAAFLIIFFIMILFFAASGYLKSQRGEISIERKGLGGGEVFGFETYRIGNKGVQEEILAFLSREVEIEGKRLKVRDLVQEGLEEDMRAEKFKSEFESFFSSRGYAAWGVGVYEGGEENEKFRVVRGNCDEDEDVLIEVSLLNDREARACLALGGKDES